MIWHRSIAHIEHDWQDLLDYSVEAGDLPLLDLGLSDNTLDGVMGLLAIHNLTTSSFHPSLRLTFSAGGNGGLWLWMLADAHEMKQTSQLTMAFTGVDPATHMASLTTHVGPGGRSANWTPKVVTTGLPTAVRWLTFPQIEPSAISPWQALPLTISTTRPMDRVPNPSLVEFVSTNRTTSDSPSSDARLSTNESEPWLVGSALVMCFLLLLVAFLS